MLRTADIVEALGGRKVLKRQISNLNELRQTVGAGLPYASLEAVMVKFGLARGEAASALHLPQRTFARRKKNVSLVSASRIGCSGLLVLARMPRMFWEARRKPPDGCAGPTVPWATRFLWSFSKARSGPGRSRKSWGELSMVCIVSLGHARLANHSQASSVASL